MPKSAGPVGFLSYAHVDDAFGAISAFRDHLATEVAIQIGEPFPIFQDRDIAWGEQWRRRIQSSLDDAAFLIAIITPTYFRRNECRSELERFLERETALSRTDLVLPLYWVDTPLLNDPEARKSDKLAEAIANRQYADWRELRFEPMTSPRVARAVSVLAAAIRDAISRRSEAPPEEAAPASDTAANENPPHRTQQKGSQVAAAVASAQPVAHNEPNTHVVDAHRKGAIPRISIAVQQASAGDRIVVLTGTYREAIVIDKPLEIVGQGDREKIIIEAAGRDVVSFKSHLGRISNVTIRQKGGPGTWYAIDIAQGRPEIANCDISSDSLACVAIRGGADPRIHDNIIHGGRDVGILAVDSSLGTIEDNHIHHCVRAGVDISDRAFVVVRRNRIHDQQKGGGIYVHERGNATIEDNEIFGNGAAAVEVSIDASATIIRNRLHNSTSGVFIERATATIEDNDIEASTEYAAVEVTNPTSEVALRRNKLRRGVEGGILARDAGSIRAEENIVTENRLAAIEIRKGMTATLSNNTVRDNLSHGIYVHNGSSATVSSNKIVSNGREGIAIYERSSAVVTENAIDGNSHHGVAVGSGCTVRLLNNTITNNKLGDTSFDDAATIEHA